MVWLFLGDVFLKEPDYTVYVVPVYEEFNPDKKNKQESTIYNFVRNP